MATTTHLTTADELLQMGSDAPYELWEGVLKEVSSSSSRSSEISLLLAIHVGQFVLNHGLGHMTTADGGYLLQDDPQTVVSPDFGFVRHARLPGGFPRRGFCAIPPDLAAEVISPTDRRADIAQKQALYERAGVPLVWWVDPEARTVAVHRPGRPVEVLDESMTLDGGEVLPGFSIPVASIFAIKRGAK